MFYDWLRLRHRDFDCLTNARTGAERSKANNVWFNSQARVSVILGIRNK